MIFRQQHFSRTTLLELREHGLYVSQRDGQARVEAELAYEEMLPVRLERRSAVPTRLPLALLWGAVWVAVHLGRGIIKAEEGLSAEGWGLLFLLGVAAVGVYFYGLRYWWNQILLHTARTTVVLHDSSASRREVDVFARALEKNTKDYLRQHHAQVNPLGLIEPQLRRLRWLQDLDVLSPAESRALATRLTGRVGADTLQSMGLELEAPYVN